MARSKQVGRERCGVREQRYPENCDWLAAAKARCGGWDWTGNNAAGGSAACCEVFEVHSEPFLTDAARYGNVGQANWLLKFDRANSMNVVSLFGL